MCLKGFQGYGYNSDFVKNMTEVNSKRKLDQTTIILTNSEDDICKFCPNLKNGLCENEEQNKRIVEMDNEVLKKLDISKEHNAVKLFKKIDSIFNTQDSVSKICFKCKWQDKCLFYQKL